MLRNIFTEVKYHLRDVSYLRMLWDLSVRLYFFHQRYLKEENNIFMLLLKIRFTTQVKFNIYKIIFNKTTVIFIYFLFFVCKKVGLFIIIFFYSVKFRL